MLLVQVQQFGIGSRYDLEILHQCDKMVNTKSQKVLGLMFTFVEVSGEKQGVGTNGGGGAFCTPDHNRVKGKPAEGNKNTLLT